MGKNDRKYSQGDVVWVRHDVPWRRKMIVKEISFSRFKEKESLEPPKLTGIRCFWLTDSGEYQERDFDTRDLTICPQ